MTTPTVLVATWGDGLFIVGGETRGQELAHQSVRTLAPDGHGGALAVVDGRSLRRRAPDGVWSTIATTAFDLACCVAVGDVIYIGTDDAKWIGGIADTRCIATHGAAVAIADRNGNLYVSGDTGRSWSHPADGLPPPSSALIA